MNLKIKQNIFCIFLLGVAFDVCALQYRSIHGLNDTQQPARRRRNNSQEQFQGNWMPAAILGVLGVCILGSFAKKTGPSGSPVNASMPSASAPVPTATPAVVSSGPPTQSGTWINPIPNMYFNIASYIPPSPRSFYDFLGRGVVSVGQSLLGVTLLVGAGLYWKRGYNPSAWSKDIGTFMRFVCGTSRACRKIKKRITAARARTNMYEGRRTRARELMINDDKKFTENVRDQENRLKQIPEHEIIQDLNARKKAVSDELSVQIPNSREFERRLDLAIARVQQGEELRWV